MRGNQHATRVLRDWADGIGRRRRQPAGASAATSGARGRSSSTRAPAACSSRERRAIVDEEEWEWIVEQASGDFDHLLIATTVPFLLSPGLDRLEAWSERVCDGAWGRLAARRGEKLRRAVDFDHWASFQQLLRRRCASCSTRSPRGERGKPPARSSSSPATSTTPTWRDRPTRRGGRGADPSTRRSARPTATRSTASERR